MRKYILLLSIMTLSTNFFLIDKITTSNEYSIQISEEKELEKIQPTGAWFTEDDELP